MTRKTSDAVFICERCPHCGESLDIAPSPASAPIVLFDIDGVIFDVHGQPFPGVSRLIDVLMVLGYKVEFWSAGGTAHIGQALQRAGIYGWFTSYDKPAYPVTEEAALAVVGRRPALQIDDDPTERVADWPFMQWSPASAPTAALDEERGKALAAIANIDDFARHGKATLTPEDVANLKAMLALDVVLIGRALAAAQDTPDPLPATCVCGANPPTRPWSGVTAYCRDGNGNFMPGHGYAAPAAPEGRSWREASRDLIANGDDTDDGLVPTHARRPDGSPADGGEAPADRLSGSNRSHPSQPALAVTPAAPEGLRETCDVCGTPLVWTPGDEPGRGEWVATPKDTPDPLREAARAVAEVMGRIPRSDLWTVEADALAALRAALAESQP